MKAKSNGSIQRHQKPSHVQGEGPNWILIAGGALLSTLSIRIGWRLKQAFDAKQSINARSPLKENGKCEQHKRPGTCKLHSNLCRYTSEEDGCYHCLSENSNGEVNKHVPSSPTSNNGDRSLPLVKIPAEPSKDPNGVMWAASPDLLELPQKPFHRSNSSDSPSFSESGSDIYSKREVIQKLRQQLKRRDEMIIEMQAQIMDLRNSLSTQMNHSAHLQAQLDSVNRDLFDSGRELQRLRKLVADRHLAVNGGANGYLNGVDELEKGRGEVERVEMLKREVGDLKEVIVGKEFLLRSYKEQKVELSAKVKELQLRLNSHVPDIL